MGKHIQAQGGIARHIGDIRRHSEAYSGIPRHRRHDQACEGMARRIHV